MFKFSVISGTDGNSQATVVSQLLAYIFYSIFNDSKPKLLNFLKQKPSDGSHHVQNQQIFLNGVPIHTAASQEKDILRLSGQTFK